MATGDETIVRTSLLDNRKLSGNFLPVWEMVITATYDDDDTGDVTLEIDDVNGWLQTVVMEVPNTTNAITTQCQIRDSRDNVVFDSGEKAENATYVFEMHKPLAGKWEVVVGVSGAVGANGSSIVIVLRGM